MSVKIGRRVHHPRRTSTRGCLLDGLDEFTEIAVDFACVQDVAQGFVDVGQRTGAHQGLALLLGVSRP